MNYQRFILLLSYFAIYLNRSSGYSFGNFSVEKRTDCSWRQLSSVPEELPINTTHLDLSHNAIKTIENATFKEMKQLTVLDLSHNEISELKMDSFVGLYHLEVLNISHNQLRMPNDFIPGVFHPLNSLQILRMHGTRNFGTYPDTALKDLTSLQELYIQGTQQAFGAGFTLLMNLTALHLRPPICDMGHIRHYTFSNLKNSNLTDLSIQRCSVRSIEENALVHFPALKTLNMACNYLPRTKDALNAAAAIPGQPVETLVLDGASQNRLRLEDRYFTKETICDKQFPNLKRASVRQNWLEEVSFDVLACMPSLQVVNMGFNPMTSTDTPWKVFTESTKEYWMTSNITELDYSFGMSPYENMFELLYCSEDTLDTNDYFKNYQLKYDEDLEEVATDDFKESPMGLDVKFNPKMQILHFDNLQFILRGFPLFCMFSLSPNNDIRFLNVSYNKWGDLICEITGLWHLQDIDLSYCGVKIFKSIVFKSAPNLRRIILTGNELGSNHQQLETFLEFAPKLDSIILSDNGIKHLPRKTFTYTRNLTKIDLSKNSIADFDIDLTYNKKLHKLDVTDNLLPLLPTQFINELRKRPVHFATLNIDLLGNPFQCNCEAIEFLSFIKDADKDHSTIKFQNLNKYSCLYKNVTTLLIDVNIENLQENCKERNYYVVIIATSVTFIVIVIASAILVYRKRWKIAWQIYEMRRYVRQGGQGRDLAMPPHRYKVFVAYATLDDVGLPWMRYELLPRVEQEWNRKAFILDRDSLVGPFLEEVTNGIKHSEKKLFVVTKQFLRLYQWPMVLHWCVDSGLSELIMVLIDIKVRNLPPSMANVAMVLEKRYPTHVLQYNTTAPNDNFWPNLKTALEDIRKKRRKVTVIETDTM